MVNEHLEILLAWKITKKRLYNLASNQPIPIPVTCCAYALSFISLITSGLGNGCGYT
jgi:hypothetical protein